MKEVKIITTSWDDGHPLDFRVAELLDKYHLKGTFYIPQANPENKVMAENDVALLSNSFEIGGHTMGHVNLKKASYSKTVAEVYGSYYWLTQVTGTHPVAFCPPFGACNSAVLDVIDSAGFKVVRTTQLLSSKMQLPVCHTTLQLYPHSSYTYTKHLLVRSRLHDLMHWALKGPTANLLKLVDLYLNDINLNGGCFHLWGHSWEIEKFNLWKNLEAVLVHLAGRDGFSYLTNGQLPHHEQHTKTKINTYAHTKGLG